MGTLTWWQAALISALLAAAACGGGSLDPQPVPSNRANCARCGMIVSELTSAAQAVSAGEEPKFYDDRGCLAKDAPTLLAEWRLYVQLDGARGWKPAAEAFYAFPQGARTPMGYGVTAFATEAEARRADRDARAHAWNDVVQVLRDK